MNHAEWVKHGAELHKSANSHQFLLGDWLNSGIASFGKEAAFEAVQNIASNKRNFFTRCAAIAALYNKSLRFPALSFTVYERLKNFPMSFLEKFLPEVADSGRSAKQILAVAVERFGRDCAPHRKLAKRFPVRLESALYHRLTEHAKTKNVQPQTIVAQVLENYLTAPQSAGKSAEGSCPSDFPAPADTQTRPETSAEESTPRPTYAERRREAQKAEQQPKPRKFAERSDRKYTCKHKLLFTACKPDAWVDGEVPTQFSTRKVGATRFKTRERADVAAREYQEDRGYAIESMRCEVCKCWHIVGKNFGPVKTAEIDLAKEQREVRVTVQDALQQHAQA